MAEVPVSRRDVGMPDDLPKDLGVPTLGVTAEIGLTVDSCGRAAG